MSTRAQHFDAIVIGAGQGGGPLAGALAGAGRRVALIEREHVGGTCINLGCTPTKTMVASAEIAHLARRAADFGVEIGDVRVDMERVRERTRSVVETFRNGSRTALEAQDGLELVFGSAKMTGPKRIEVTTPGGRADFEADIIVVNTGQCPRIPPIDGLGETPFLTNETMIELDLIPEHLIVLGGGYVGLEFGQMFRRFGAEVTIVQRGPQIASREDEDVAAVLTDILREDGIEVLASTEAERASYADMAVELTVSREGSRSTVRGSHLLVATGRMPNTDDLGLDAAGIETDERGYIQVDEHLETSESGVYAIGDVTGGPAFTHMSYDDYRVLEANLLHGERRSTRDRVVPYTLFTDPQLGRIGSTEAQARKRGGRIGVAKIEAGAVARSHETGRTRGVWKAVVDLDNDQLLGAAILGTDGGEIASLLQVAIMGSVPCTALRDGIFSHPTYAEGLNTLFANVTEAN